MNQTFKYDFEDRPVEADTKILLTQTEQFDELYVLLEMWTWDGITAQSAVLYEDQLKNYSDADLIDKLNDHIEIGEKYTVVRSKDGFAFVNYNFQT